MSQQLTVALYSLGGTSITFLATALGAAMVFFFKKEISDRVQSSFLGFAAGIMIAASVWSLLIPAIDMASEQGKMSVIPAGGGFLLGGLFLFALDKLLPHIHSISGTKEGLPSKFKRSTMLVLAVTLHNIPEGMAVGLAFSIALTSGDHGAFMAAIALTVGMAIQNFPEGAAISLPLKKEGLSNKRAFLFGAFSGIVEPIGGVITAIIATQVVSSMPWILSFSAGAMIFVVVEDLIPQANLDDHSHAGTIGVMLGFLIMMVLDVALG